ncbi:uncharacterized protein FIBRA_02687 [Fibroporia radiculosa]|uniref:Nucleoside diphosphate kinase n=1 Tax=Fibroporia radiculosa TaxID=599839 RepID=J4H1Z8_9APHY|nr:uncharacterized protein FIBRA_02687 [Fibroporia radiculosa]CCM00649.1 predicted protein [Fibroporia radiculosa]
MSDTMGSVSSPANSLRGSPLHGNQFPEPQAEPEEFDAPSTPIPTSTSLSLPTRTVAIIKPHALNNRFDIEQRITEAGFEIVKERQMEFDIDTDPETMYELFGEDYECFAEGPVWVYVLERRRAVEVWATLMGHPDPAVARSQAPHSLRALYGISAHQNAVMGSPDVQIADFQISAIFASSPPFPTTELPDVGLNGHGYTTGSMRSVSSSVLSALRKSTSSVDNHSSTPSNGKSPFKARPLPSTHVAPDIVPRMSRAAALRAGLPVEKPQRVPPSKERLAKTFENVPGHKRSETITVASTAPPVVAPRMTRAASLRLGLKPAEKPRKSIIPSADAKRDENKATFDGVPGHKRRETISVASTRPPSVVPRSNRSASLRQIKDAAPPSSFMFRTPSNQPSSRSSSRNSYNQPTSSRVSLSRPASAAAVQTPASRPIPSRVTSGSTMSSGPSRPSTSAGIVPSATNGVSTPSKSKPRPSAPPPAITPRTNKSALLRAAKMANAATPAVSTTKAKKLPAQRTVKV